MGVLKGFTGRLRSLRAKLEYTVLSSYVYLEVLEYQWKVFQEKLLKVRHCGPTGLARMPSHRRLVPSIANERRRCHCSPLTLSGCLPKGVPPALHLTNERIFRVDNKEL
jgi:hypothetical protein